MKLDRRLTVAVEAVVVVDLAADDAGKYIKQPLVGLVRCTRPTYCSNLLNLQDSIALAIAPLAQSDVSWVYGYTVKTDESAAVPPAIWSTGGCIFRTKLLDIYVA